MFTLNWSATVCTTVQAAGFRCMSEMCSTLVAVLSGSYTGNDEIVL